MTCPWCSAAEVVRVSAYGPMHMAEQWFCEACHSPFERVRKRTSDTERDG